MSNGDNLPYGQNFNQPGELAQQYQPLPPAYLQSAPATPSPYSAQAYPPHQNPQGQQLSYPQAPQPGQQSGYQQDQQFYPQGQQTGYGYYPGQQPQPYMQSGYGNYAMPPQKKRGKIVGIVVLAVFVLAIVTGGGIGSYYYLSTPTTIDYYNRYIPVTKMPSPLPFHSDFYFSNDSHYVYYPKDGSFYLIEANKAVKVQLKTSDYDPSSTAAGKSIGGMSGHYGLVVRLSDASGNNNAGQSYSVYLFDLQNKIQIETPKLIKDLFAVYLSNQKFLVQISKKGQASVYNLDTKKIISNFTVDNLNPDDVNNNFLIQLHDDNGFITTSPLSDGVNNYLFFTKMNQGFFAINLDDGSRKDFTDLKNAHRLQPLADGYIFASDKDSNSLDNGQNNMTFTVVNQQLNTLGSVNLPPKSAIHVFSDVSTSAALKGLKAIANKGASGGTDIANYQIKSDGSFVDLNEYMRKQYGADCVDVFVTSPDFSQYLCMGILSDKIYNKGSKQPVFDLKSIKQNGSLLPTYGGYFYFEFDSGIKSYFL